MSSIVVVGAGVFGASTALEYAKNGHHVILLEKYKTLDTRASSTDLNRIIRSDYRGDTMMHNLAERAMEKWKEWNLFHGDGQLVLSQLSNPSKGSYIHDQFQLLQQRDPNLRFLSFEEIGDLYPIWKWTRNNKIECPWNAGFISKRSGWVPATKGLQYLLQQCQVNGVDIRCNTLITKIECQTVCNQNSSCRVRVDTNNGIITADLIIFCCGIWTQEILQKLGFPLFEHIKITSNLCGYFRVKSDEYRSYFESHRFPNFLADIERTGYYGFALHDGLIKIAQHELFDPDPTAKYKDIEDKKSLFERIQRKQQRDESLRECMDHMLCFVEQQLPFGHLLELERFDLCYYSKSDDHHFLIDYVPGYEGKVAVAGGGSGHSFKFAPVLGQIVKKCLDHRGDSNDCPFEGRFQWKSRINAPFFGNGSSQPIRSKL